jgi:hypothetical protein
MTYNFIRTTDEDTKNTLVREGFKLISQDGRTFTFLNDKPLSFEDKNKKIQYSNILTF